MVSRSATIHSGYSGAFFAPFRYLLYLVVLLAGLLLSAWVIDAFFVFKIWADGIHRLGAVVAADTAASDLPYGVEWIRSQGVIWANALYQALFVASSIDQIITADPRSLQSFDQAVQRFFVSMLPALQVAMRATKLFGLRLAEWLSGILAVALGYSVGMIDGLVERSIRRHCGGRESATLYHRAKYAIAGLVGLSLFVNVCLPIIPEFRFWSWEIAAVIGLLARLQWKCYKKYL